MPIYEYACKKCDGEFEVSQRITDEPLKRSLCPHCGKRTAVTKLISRSSFHLKGSGWYMTDYGKNGPKSSDSDGEKSAKSSESKSGETKNETKGGTKSSGSSSTNESTSQSASSSAS